MAAPDWALLEAPEVDVEIQNHPMYDGFLGQLERLKARRTP